MGMLCALFKERQPGKMWYFCFHFSCHPLALKYRKITMLKETGQKLISYYNIFAYSPWPLNGELRASLYSLDLWQNLDPSLSQLRSQQRASVTHHSKHGCFHRLHVCWLD